MKIGGLPLFVLGPDFFPGFSGTLRVFEPRYKQMMDDCIIDSKPFGYISSDLNMEALNGWTQPSNYGTICHVRSYEEAGSNLIIEVEGTSAFSVKKVIQPVLPSLTNGEMFPGVDELMQKAGNPVNGKLYLRADVELINKPLIDYDHHSFRSFVDMIAPAKQLLEMSSMYKGQLLEVKDPEEYIDDSERSDFIWKVCCAICYDVKLQQHMLSETSFSSLMEICKIKINEILLKLEEE